LKSTKAVKIGASTVGPGHPCFIVAEIGINHNGDLDTALQLIDAAVEAGCQAVKFQKRTVDLVYAPDDLERPRESPFGTTNGDLKRALEFGEPDYRAIDTHCREKGILWFASCWDEGSVDFIEAFNPPCYKVASACLTHDELLERYRTTGRPVILSTGMSTMGQIHHAVKILGQERLVILHTTSTYPSRVEDLNLRVMQTLQSEFICTVGYSGHEVGLQTSVAAVALGACMIERHLTLDRAMWGSDQAASVEPHGFSRLVRDIRTVELAMGDGVKRVLDDEVPIMQKLRRTPRKAMQG
jgi:N-acetylneuraminate synthase